MRVRPLDLPDDGLANAGHTHDLELGRRSQQRAQPSKDNRVVVGADDPNHRPGEADDGDGGQGQAYIVVPWLIVLPWSILQQSIFFQIFKSSGAGVFATELGTLPWQVTYALLWYVLSFAPNIMIGIIYSRRTRAVTMWRALVLGHLMIAWNYIGYIAAWRALWRLARRQDSWTKTPRTDETRVAGRHRQRPMAALSPQPDRSS